MNGGHRSDDNRPGASHALALFLSGCLAACSTIPERVSDYGPAAAAAELTGTPFHPQERYQCGPAALMTILEASGAGTDMDTLIRRVYLPARQGSLQTELVAATRAEGRIPYQLAPKLSSLGAELKAGRPVLVLQNLGVSWLPRWHYAVVVGVNPEADEIVLRSGTERRRVTRTATFLRTWRRSGYWSLVALRPGEMPAEADRERWFDTLAALEETGHIRNARAGWQAALGQWPDATVARFGLANSEFLLGNWAGAEAGYRALLVSQPGLVMVRNNLAAALLKMERVDEARDEAMRALRQAEGTAAYRQAIEETLAEIDAAAERM
ncbi:MAG: PA2778 family cysteine peptidase [Woeseia sp.]